MATDPNPAHDIPPLPDALIRRIPDVAKRIRDARTTTR